MLIGFWMIVESFSRDEVNIRSRFSVLHFDIVRTHNVRETREQFPSLGHLHVVSWLRRPGTYGKRDTLTVQVFYQRLSTCRSIQGYNITV